MVKSQVTIEPIPYWYQTASSNHTADRSRVIAIKKDTIRCRHVDFGCLLSATLSLKLRSLGWRRERDESKREKRERSDIGFVLLNKGFDHSKVYNTLTIQIE